MAVTNLVLNTLTGEAVDKGIEVLLLTDPVDAVWTTTIFDFKETPLKAVGKGEIELEEEKKEEKADEPAAEEKEEVKEEKASEEKAEEKAEEKPEEEEKKEE